MLIVFQEIDSIAPEMVEYISAYSRQGDCLMSKIKPDMECLPELMKELNAYLVVMNFFSREVKTIMLSSQ